MKTDEELGFISREEIRRRTESLAKAVNPKPYTKEETEKIKAKLRKQKRL